ncbi:resistance domain protein [Medicago truncatula]|uniref:Resistance domain protein n=1 Tax=Medicago truncatula TaxID=3880 RepID=G7KL65_MEDTR|nr:resistance domain protein [Medicago truncatula]
MLINSCRNLRSIPPLKLDLLETFDLSYCHSLENFPIVMDGFLGKLKTLNVNSCDNLRSVPPLKLDSLETFDLTHCHSLESFPIVVDGFLGKLKTLLVEGCHNLRSIPPLKLDLLETLNLSCCYNLKSFSLVVGNSSDSSMLMLSAVNCMSLTSSCKSRLLNQELHKAGNTWFCLPRVPKIPEWFNHIYEAGLSISFWFRNKFPDIARVVSPFTWDDSHYRAVRFIINGDTFFYTDDTKPQPNKYIYKALLENKWNHAEVDFGFPFQNSGIHVLKEKSNMKDIQFTRE